MLQKIKNNRTLFLFLVANLIFLILYHAFIIGGNVYAYYDTGSDTFMINYPYYQLFVRMFHELDLSSYSLNAGLGTDVTSNLFQYLNPFNTLILLFPASLVHIGMILATYLKLMTISIFAYKFYNRLLHHNLGAICGALAWTFSSWVILWGQQYGFCTSMALFTMFMYFVQRFVDKRDTPKNYLLIPVMTLMLLSNYYYFYMAGLFSVVYIIIYMLFNKEKLISIFKKLCHLAGLAVFALGIGFVTLMPVVYMFFGSARASEVSMTNWWALLRPYSQAYLYSFLGRLFSNNTLGTALAYSGVANYYEMAMLFTSALLFFALPYLIIKKTTRRNTLIISVLCILALILPITGKIMTFNPLAQRWTYLLCFIEALGIGLFIREYTNALRDTSGKKTADKSLILSISLTLVLCACGYGLLFFAESKGFLIINRSTLYLSAAFVVLYALALLSPMIIPYSKPILALGFVGLLSVELVVMNYTTINRRVIVTKEALATDYYNDGTPQLLELLSAQDSDLYRINKTYTSASLNDAMVQDYNGMNIYISTNTQELMNYKDTYGISGMSTNRFQLKPEAYELNTLLGMRYLLVEGNPNISLEHYTPLITLGDYQVYENTLALPFGYLYDTLIDKAAFNALNSANRALAATKGFFFTEDGKGSDMAYPSIIPEPGANSSSLFPYFIGGADCLAQLSDNRLIVTNLGQDPHILLPDCGELIRSQNHPMLNLSINAGIELIIKVYYKTAEDENFSEDKTYTFTSAPTKPAICLPISEDITDLRIDIETPVTGLIFEDLSICTLEDSTSALAALQSKGVTNASFENDVYTADISNTQGNTQMLCIPLVYSSGFSATLDGQPVTLYNINGGLCGIEIPTGNHSVEMTYNVPYLGIGWIVSAVSLILYFIIYGRHFFKYKKQKALKG